jgi:hypothetical protein
MGGSVWGVGRISIENNRYEATSADSSNAFLSISTTAAGTVELDSVAFNNNTGINLFSLWVCGGTAIDWAAATSYTGFERVYADATIKRGSVVKSGADYYVCILSIAGNAGNSAPSADPTHWELYTRNTVKISITNNSYSFATNTGFLLYFLRAYIGFLVTPYARDNRINNLDGTFPQYLLKAGTNSDTITNATVPIQIQRYTPANAGDAGLRGMICGDEFYIYFCHSDTQWKRVPIVAW